MTLGLRDSGCFSPCARCTAWSGYPLITVGVLLTLHSALAATPSGLWPGGTYGLPRATELHGNGCPRSCNFTWFDDGFAFFDTRDDNNRNTFSNPLNLFGIFNENIELHFCMKTTVNGCSENVTWPTGCYCLFKFNDCPSGFDSGEINWIGGSNNRAGGVLPNGSFDPGGIRLKFCCRCDGSITIPFNLPMDTDFFLMADPRGEGSCPRVSGFAEAPRYVVWDMENSTNSTGRNPAQKINVDDGTVNITFCYYTPHQNGQDSSPVPDSPPNSGFNFSEHIPELVVVPIMIFLLVVLIVLVSVILCVVKRRRGGNYVKLQRTENTRSLLASDIQAVQNHQAEVVSSGDSHTRVTFHTTSALYTSVDYPSDQPQVPRNSGVENSTESDLQDTSHSFPLYTNVEPTRQDVRSSTKDSSQSGNSRDSFWLPPLDEKILFDSLQRMKYEIIEGRNVKILDSIGMGNFGSVCKALWTTDSGVVEVAAKSLLEGAGQKDREKFLQEAAIMGQFRHENIVKLHGIVNEEQCIIILELMSNGNLRDYLLHLRKIIRDLPQEEVSAMFLRFAREISSGMEFLSNKKFIHRDLAARNILLNDSYTAKIGDFGFARKIKDSIYYKGSGGMIPLKWTAPEAIAYKKYSTASDVWSYGCVLYEIWSLGEKPLENVQVMQVYSYLTKGLRQPPPPGCSRALYQIMIDCWNPVSQERPGFNAISYILRQPNSYLLSWGDADRAVHQEATNLGADSRIGQLLYRDLQNIYSN